MNSGVRQRSTAIDLLKTVAIICVLTIHTCRFITPVGSFDWISNLFWRSLSGAAVPIFFMCSGVLLFDPEKQLTLKKLYLKNILRILVALLFWATVYKVYFLWVNEALDIPNLIYAVKEVLLFKHYTHFYYLHITILFYALLPIVRIFVKNATRKELRYALAIWFLLGVLYPTVDGFWPFTLINGMPKQWLINMVYASLGYGLLGYYINKYGISMKFAIPSAIAGFGCVFGGTFYFSSIKGSLDTQLFEGMSVGVMLLALGVFGIMLNLSRGMGELSTKTVTYISKASFCIYLVHLIVQNVVYHFGLLPDTLPLVFVPLLVSLLLIICVGIYFVFSKLPVVKKWLV